MTQTDFDIPACFSGIDVIFIDEVSMCNHRVLVILDRKLRRLMSNDEMFGGKCVILCGDFHQCKAVKTKQLTTLCLDLLHGMDNGIPDSQNGAVLFTKFERLQLTTQHRVIDEVYTEMLEDLRNLSKVHPVTPNHLKTFDELTSQDLFETPEYLFAPTLVTSQYERETFNWDIGKEYARTYNEVMLW